MNHDGAKSHTSLDRPPERKKRYTQATTNEDLIMRIKAGDKEARGVIFERHYPAGCQFAAQLFDISKEDAEDLVSEAFLRVWKGIDLFQNRSEFRTWLFRIIINLRRDQTKNLEYKRTRPLHDLNDRNLVCADSSQVSDPEVIVPRLIQQEEVRAKIAELPPNAQEVVMLYYFEDLSYREIAEITEASETAVTSRLYQARRNLAKKLGHLSGGRQADGSDGR
jgi:RNA polymerase sigma-70 factor (ECF subfamily)